MPFWKTLYEISKKNDGGKGFGINLGETLDDRLCSLWFADDVILFASSKEVLQQMLNNMVTATKAVSK